MTPFPNFAGRRRVWTQEKVTSALARVMREIRGPLPCCDRPYNQLKKGHLDWPPSRRVCEFYGSMARGWLAAGAPVRRISMNNLDWTEEENEYLAEHAGSKTLNQIGQKLGRSYGSVKAQLNRNLGIIARDNQGYASAAQVAKNLNCSYHRLLAFCGSGKINGTYFDKTRNTWRIDIISITPDLCKQLTAERRTHKTHPLDVGDYYKRHGIIRKGNGVRVKETVC